MVTRSRTEVITAEYVPHLPSQVAEFIRADGLASWIWVLLWGKDAPIGIMGISSRESREYTSNDESLLVAIGRQLSTTVEKVRLYEETCRAYEDLRHTQEQLLQSEKMSAVGQLIAGVAHELNNPLTAILGYAQLLESEGLGERAADFVSKLFKQAQRTHRVVQNLLSFARQRKPQKERGRYLQGARRNPGPARLRLEGQRHQGGARDRVHDSGGHRRSAPARAGVSEYHQQRRGRHAGFGHESEL